MIKEVPSEDLARAIELVNRVFSEFVAVEYAQEGQSTFRDYLKTKHETLGSELRSGHKRMWAYYENDEILGVISTRDVTHISLMFVDKRRHRQGIARQMFDHVLDELKTRGDVQRITVNSSPYAVSVYERLGFVPTAEWQEANGIIYIPMMRPM